MQEWCANGSCVEDLDQTAAMVASQFVNLTEVNNTANFLLADESVGRVVNQTLQDLSKVVDADMGKLEALVNANSTAEIGMAVDQALGGLQQSLGDNWLGTLLGGFRSGRRNNGRERRGNRQGSEENAERRNDWGRN